MLSGRSGVARGCCLFLLHFLRHWEGQGQWRLTAGNVSEDETGLEVYRVKDISAVKGEHRGRGTIIDLQHSRVGCTVVDGLKASA